MLDPAAIREALHTRGFAVLPPQHDPTYIDAAREALDELHRDYGRPPLATSSGRLCHDDVTSASPAGLMFSRVFSRKPEIARGYLTPALIDVLAGVLDGPPRYETCAGMISDPDRPLLTWHCHIGGLDEDLVDQSDPAGLPADRVRRLTILLYLDAIAPDDGALWVAPRALGDPLGIPSPGREREPWPGQTEVGGPVGTIVLLEERTWHAANPRKTPGLRRLVGMLLVSADCPPTSNRDPTAESSQALLFGTSAAA